MNVWCRTHTPISLYGRQPGLTYRSTCPSIPGFGAGDTPPKIDASTDRICRLTHSIHNIHGTHRTHGTISPIQEESCPYNGTLDYPHIPRLPHVIVGGVYGVKNDIFCFVVGEVPFPSNADMCFGPWIGVAFIPPFICRLAFHTILWLCGSSTIIFAW